MNRIIQLALSIALVITSGITRAQSQETLTNQSIIQMVALGFDATIIESKINTSNNDFDVTTAALMELKKENVPNSVIASMMTAANDPSKKVVDMNDYHAPHRPGIYYYDAKGDLVELLPTITNGVKTRGTFGAVMSGGISKQKIVTQVTGTNARLQFTKAPTFYFYFNQQSITFSPNSINGYGFMSATSPNEFVLARMDVTTKGRELQIWSGNDYTEEHGIGEEQAVHFDIAQATSGVFEVNVGDPGIGQFCFLFSGEAPSSQSKVYDFGIQ